MRWLKDNYRNEIVFGNRHDKHPGMEHARVAWETYARMYMGKGSEVQHNPQPPKKTKLRVIQGDKK